MEGGESFCLLLLVGESFLTSRVVSPCRQNALCAVLRSGAELGHSEHSFRLRLIAVQTLNSCVDEDAPKISLIRRAAAENGRDVRKPFVLQSAALLPFLLNSIALVPFLSICSTLPW